MSNHQVIHICSPALDIEETFSWSDCKPGEFKEENFEVFEAIKWMVQDIQELCHDADLNSFIENFDRTYGCTLDLSNLFNKRWQSQGLTPAYLTRRASHGFLKFIIQQCYNRAVSDPDKLNQYPPFSPQVYGETSFELVSQMIEHELVRLYCKLLLRAYLNIALELRKRNILRIAQLYWIANSALEKGDFLTEDYREKIVSSGVIFANNFAFGPEVDHQLKLRFANLREGAKIISSKAFCPLNFRITDRNLGDIGSIMHVSCLNPIQDAVSWTDKPFVYYVHTIDRSLVGTFLFFLSLYFILW
ncbi:unnamed protein product [Protopolystoma xenopodis]|uniref:Histone-lysine N-methyltransferase, H3 lysine-79 specific n=1 Tax=Protopolystoma xenopodis TaxID=117903 RepID=A0A448WS94_9PLAT|nr:unnamed protein product [Protopolystoma xenopodis]